MTSNKIRPPREVWQKPVLEPIECNLGDIASGIGPGSDGALLSVTSAS